MRLDGACEAEDFVFDVAELGHGQTGQHRVGVTGHATAGLEQAQRSELGATRLVANLSLVGEVAEGTGHVLSRRMLGGVGGECDGRCTNLAGQQFTHDGRTGSTRERRVGENPTEASVTEHGQLEGRQVGRGRSQSGGVQ